MSNKPSRRKFGNTRGQLARRQAAGPIPRSLAVHTAVSSTWPEFKDVELFYSLAGTSSSGALPYTLGAMCSGLYDPDVTGAGHQPRGYDQLCTSTGPYSRYTVTSVDYDITYKNEAADVCCAGVYIGPAAATSSDVDDIPDIIERPNFTYVFLAPSGEPGHMGTIRGTMDVAKIFGRTKSQLLSDDDVSGAYGSNPARMAYLTMFGSNLTANANWVYLVRLKYKARLFGRNMAAQS